jgi:hypothetical protein
MLIRVLLIIISSLTLLFSSGAVSPSLTGAWFTELHAAYEPEDFKVEFFPVAPYHVGDKISVRVTYTGTGDIEGKEINIALSDQPETLLATENFSRYDNQAEFYWILDTDSFQPGYIQFRFEIPEVNRSWQEGINLLPPKIGESQGWAFVETNWGQIYFVEGTDAARDITQIQEIVEETIDETLNQFFPDGIPQENPLKDDINLVLVPAIIGHGGFATDMAVVTYTDRNWVGSSFETIIHHELVHVLDRKLNNDGPRPSILSEGIAVYLSGGHYRDGDPLLRASALVSLGKYIPLETLADDFYNAQHEIAYMEGAALVAYLVEMWGWEDFLDFYFTLEEEGSDSATISSALENKTGMDLNQLENAFITYLDTLDPENAVISDVHLTIEVYDMIRRYQTALIPSAHFRTAWWPPIDRVLEMGITGDYDQREKAPLNILIENQLLDIQQAFSTQDYQRIEEHLDTIDAYLDIIEGSGKGPSHYHLGWPLPHRPQIINKP